MRRGNDKGGGEDKMGNQVKKGLIWCEHGCSKMMPQSYSPSQRNPYAIIRLSTCWCSKDSLHPRSQLLERRLRLSVTWLAIRVSEQDIKDSEEQGYTSADRFCYCYKMAGTSMLLWTQVFHTLTRLLRSLWKLPPSWSMVISSTWSILLNSFHMLSSE